MTQNIPSTTERVVSLPTLSALPQPQTLEAADGGNDEAEDRHMPV
jgi:hypothetical protein